jgi:hypothetical protein
MALIFSLHCLGLNALALTIDSSDFEFSCDWSEKWWTLADGQLHTAGGGFSSSSKNGAPLSANIQSTPYGWNFSKASIDSFTLSTDTYSAADEMYYPWGTGSVLGTHMNTYAASTTLFHPCGTELAINLRHSDLFSYADGPLGMRVTITDLTTPATLIDTGDLRDSYGGTEVYDIKVDPSHEYDLTMSGSSHAWAANEIRMGLQVQIFDAPDIGMTSLLLGVSLSALFGAKKDFWLPRTP